jgi:hypothetical protein
MHCYQQCVSINALLPKCASVTGLISVCISIHALLTSSVHLSIKYQTVCICQCTITSIVHLSMHVCSWCASANALFQANTCEIFNMRFFQFRWCHFCRLSSQVCITMGRGGGGGWGVWRSEGSDIPRLPFYQSFLSFCLISYSLATVLTGLLKPSGLNSLKYIHKINYTTSKC